MDIPFRKSRNITIYLASLLMLIASLFLLFMPPTTTHPILGSKVFFGLISLLFLLFSWKLFSTAWKRNHKTVPAMQITGIGIEDFSSPFNKGFISWEDISGFEIKEVVNSKFIVVYLKSPEDYLNLQKKGWRKKQLQDRYINYGSPYCITTSTMRTNTKALFEILEKYRMDYYDNKIA